MNDKTIQITITDEDINNYKRLDAFLADKIEGLSRTLIKKLANDGHLTSDDKFELKKMPKSGTTLVFSPPEIQDTELMAEDIPLEILFEDEFLIILNKPAGIVVHPAPGNYTGTLVNAILFHCKDLKGIGNEKRPGIVHRLDKGTSGIMVVAKEQKTHEGLVDLFSKHDIERKYEAICLGSRLPQKQTLESLIGRHPNNRLKMTTNISNGKKAITHMSVLEEFERFTHVELKLETGRTHQIRVHLSELLNSPILNDPTYGRTKEEQRFFNKPLKDLIAPYEHPFLHAKVLGFIHPITKQKLHFRQEPPKIFTDTIELLRDSY